MTPKYFKKSSEILWGLDAKNLLKIIAVYLGLFASGISLKLSPAHPLFIFLAIIATIITAFIIKACREDEIRGYYSSLIFHPLADHIYLEDGTDQGYKTVRDLDPIAGIDIDALKTKEQDLVNIIEVKHGFCFNRASQEEIDRIINEWQNIIIELHKINIIDSYFFTSAHSKQSLQIFISAEPYNYPSAFVNENNNHNIQFANQLHLAWYKDFTQSHRFTSQLKFFICIKEANPHKIKRPIKYFINRYCPFIFKEIRLINPEEKEEQIKLLNQKTSNILDFCNGFNLNASKLETNAAELFRETWLNHNNLESKSYFRDAGKFLENNFKNYLYTKTYRLQELPTLSEKKLWLWDLIQRLACTSTISIMIETRNPHSDRRKAEAKLKNCIKRPLDTGNKLKQIEENKGIYASLAEQPYSYDLSIHLSIYVQSIQELKRIDNEIKKPLNSARISSLDRMQIPNYFSALPFCTNTLKDADKIFSTIEPIGLSLPLIDTRLGTRSGPLLGIALADHKPIYLDEYNREYFHNRAINFIGDSGSGKTVAAKLAIKRRIHDNERSFFIIDNTEDGWEFFIDYFGGRKIDIDQSTNSQTEALFAPLVLETDINEHIDKCLDLFALLQNNDSKLSNDERNFLTDFLKGFYKQESKRSLSELIYELERYQCQEEIIRDKWLKILAPYTKIKNGIYAGLLDSKESTISEKLVLFTFSKIKTNTAYHDASIFLISDFLSTKVKKQAKTTLVIDEAWKIFKNSKNQSGKELLCHLARAGRGLDLGLWTISQKPSDLPAEIHSSASSSLCFQLKERQDRLDMIRYANFNDREEKLINSIQLSKAGNAVFKTTIDSGLINLILDPFEDILCSSVREFSNKRKQIFQEYLVLTEDRQRAAYMTTKNLIHA